jgi:hypothetical protein
VPAVAVSNSRHMPSCAVLKVNLEFSQVGRPAGLEPTTRCLEGTEAPALC